MKQWRDLSGLLKHSFEYGLAMFLPAEKEESRDSFEV